MTSSRARQTIERVRTQGEFASAVWATWGAKGIRRRTTYEVLRRVGVLRHAERLRSTAAVGLRPIDITPQVGDEQLDGWPPRDRAVRLYGALDLAARPPIDWHRHPLTGHRYAPDAHWSSFSDSVPDAGDIKDLWELARFGWLHPWLRSWASSGDVTVAEEIWSVIEHWIDHNPPFDGPHWMCGQETSLRAINVLFMADALSGSASSTPARRTLVAELTAVSVARVAPSLGYALSQRNNHAISEAGFLWTASHLVEGLPGAARLRRKSARALAEIASDQFADDGSYAQHSPTYQRLALHVLLWCLHVARSTDEAPPPGIAEAVHRSVPFLRSLVAPGSPGRVPNLGGNDGALLFDLAPTPITDLRPVIAHAAAATQQPSGLPSGPWDAELHWFGLSPIDGEDVQAPPQTASTHALTRGSAHAVLRAGPLHRRPTNADQLHTDVWIDGHAVAVDPGSYRYTAPRPWNNALAGEDVHNLPSRAGAPQAVKAGRFFWRRWATAEITRVIDDRETAAIVAVLVLPDGTRVQRLVAVNGGLVVVVDEATSAIAVRWNLPAEISTTLDRSMTRASADGWAAHFTHDRPADVLRPTEDDPTSGWQAPTYGVREPVTALLIGGGGEQDDRVVSCFGPSRRADDLASLAAAASVAPDLASAAAVEEIFIASRAGTDGDIRNPKTAPSTEPTGDPILCRAP